MGFERSPGHIEALCKSMFHSKEKYQQTLMHLRVRGIEHVINRLTEYGRFWVVLYILSRYVSGTLFALPSTCIVKSGHHCLPATSKSQCHWRQACKERSPCRLRSRRSSCHLYLQPRTHPHAFLLLPPLTYRLRPSRSAKNTSAKIQFRAL